MTDRSNGETEVTDGVAAVYDQIRRALGVESSGESVVTATPILAGVTPGMQEIRAAALRTPTLPPATHTACYLVGPCEGPGEVYVVDPASPYPDQQDALDRLLDAERDAGRRVAA